MKAGFSSPVHAAYQLPPTHAITSAESIAHAIFSMQVNYASPSIHELPIPGTEKHTSVSCQQARNIIRVTRPPFTGRFRQTSMLTHARRHNNTALQARDAAACAPASFLRRRLAAYISLSADVSVARQPASSIALISMGRLQTYL